MHRAMRVVARAEAKQEIAVLKIMDVFLQKSTALQGQRLTKTVEPGATLPLAKVVPCYTSRRPT